MASRFGVHPNQIYKWRALLVDDTASVFVAGRGGLDNADVALVSELYGKLGELTVERDFYYGGPVDEPGRTTSDGEPDTSRSSGGPSVRPSEAKPVVQFITVRPRHRVAIPRPFAVGKFEVTRGEFDAFVRTTRRDMSGDCWFWNVAEEKWEIQA